MGFTVLGMSLGKLAGAVLPAAASLIGGKADRDQRNKELAMQDPVYMRKRYEAAGLNPALIGGSTPLQGLGYAPSFGATMSGAVNTFLNTRAEQEQLEIQKTQLEQENQRLEQLAQRAVLRPTIGGVYSRNEGYSAPAGSVPRSSSVPAGRSDGDTADLNPRAVAGDNIDSERETRVLENTSGSGVTVIENDYTRGPLYVAGADGEPWGLDELAAAGLQAAPQIALRAGRAAGRWLRAESERNAHARRVRRALREQEEWNDAIDTDGDGIPDFGLPMRANPNSSWPPVNTGRHN